jgi:hypothetical protein
MNSRDAVSGTYPDAQFNAKNQNLVQGQIHSLSLAEINFPFDVPNVQDGFNSFSIDYIPEDPPGTPIYAEGIYLQPTIAAGFYTGAELAYALNNAIAEACAANTYPRPPGTPFPLDPTRCVSFSYDAVTNRFTIHPPEQYYVAAGYPTFWQIDSSWTFPDAEAPANRVIEGELGKDLLSIMGFVRNTTNQFVNGVQLPGTFPFFRDDENNVPAVGGSAPMAFTQYIDVCSPQLCKFQDLNGGSTTNLARRGNLICRLYISNNIAVSGDGAVEGTRPFVICRQFQNARIMKWTIGNSVGQMDIQLYDDTGKLLTTSWAPRPYQITFNVYEGGDEKEAVVGADGSVMTLPKYAPYSPQNANAWSSPSFPMGRR